MVHNQRKQPFNISMTSALFAEMQIKYVSGSLVTITNE